MTSLSNASILITGGTGSFGQKFVRHLLDRHNPRRIVVYSRDELKQYEMAQSIQAPQLRYFIGDIRDRERLVRALHGIDTIVHAAAMKQIVAAEYNPIECIKTNIIGAENVINAAIDCGVKKVIALSTDKAVNPINLYGATKLCSDKLFIAGNHLAGRDGPRFSVVRYGNVVGSRGSVVPLFEKLRGSGCLPITDERMTRFWITLKQGAAFVDRCLGLMQGGEVFIPKIPSMRVTDLAAAMAPECRQEVVGIRPGEKLHECMIPHDEARLTREFDDFYVILPSMPLGTAVAEPVYDGVKGRPVAENFEYSSDTNDRWADRGQLLDMIK
ncbi:MAG TPA: UDP-N-acetylglucosamine 4,6-dehydratase (inverting) [Xanthobacteraceae bacterium]|nr:UDP-N-acetylglucosamine 4,6-dehydratase (inverting) [Xanthobacteraceae bacterium]